MPANTAPIYSLTPQIGLATFTSSYTANTKSDGTGTIGTDILKILTGGANGTFVEGIRISLSASAAGTATTATVLRVFLSTVTSGATTNANTLLFVEVQLPSQTADSSSTATYFIDVPINKRIPANETVLLSCHAAPAANTTVQATCFAGDY